ncbi:MAG TPA: cyclic nucleotide-binding domain-containing protein, partial [Vicinamibacteria bacterium]|nr:cyclic nucleotide-binding domain-containing protein [Vicinamibacteria bacterium]
MAGPGTPRMNPEFLRRVRLFEALEVPELAEILMLGVVKESAKDDVIFEDGAAGDSFYVIYDGAVRISKVFQQMGEEALTILGPGEFFGEMSF